MSPPDKAAINNDDACGAAQGKHMTARARILFVDDEKRVLNSMRGLFRRDFELFLTTDGAAAIKIAAESAIDVVVADQRMPGMTGTEVLGKVKELSPRTIRILLTGYADQDAVQGSINVGEVFRFLSKPCPPKLLRETLESAVAAARATVANSTEETPEVAAQPATMPDQAAKRPDAGAKTQSAPSPSERPSVRSPVTHDRPGPPAASVPATESARTVPDEQPAEVDTDASSSHWHTITNVVLSGESSKESYPDDVGANTLAMTKDVGVVVFTVDPTFAELAIRAVSKDRSTTLATTLSKVAHEIEQHDAGILVTDFTTKRAVLQKIIGTLKKYLPELVTIVVSGSRDTTDMISLINYGQVFRYLLKPVDSVNLRNDINAAAIRHMQLLNHPELVKRHQVGNLTDQPDASPTLNDFVSKIQNLQSRRSTPTENSN